MRQTNPYRALPAPEPRQPERYCLGCFHSAHAGRCSTCQSRCLFDRDGLRLSTPWLLAMWLATYGPIRSSRGSLTHVLALIAIGNAVVIGAGIALYFATRWRDHWRLSRDQRELPIEPPVRVETSMEPVACEPHRDIEAFAVPRVTAACCRAEAD